MEQEELIKQIRKQGFDNLNDFIKANLHYLSKKNQRQFYLLSEKPNKKYHNHQTYSQRSDYAQN